MEGFGVRVRAVATPHWKVIVVLVLGLSVRLWLSSARGYEGDVATYQHWARSAVKLGLARSYSEQVGNMMLPNYPPLSMMIFAAVGKVYQVFFSPDFIIEAPVYRSVIKMPAIIADLATAVLLYRLVRKGGGRRPWVAAAIYLAHPAVFYDSAVWGQTDGLYTVFIVAALVAYTERRLMAFGGFIAAAALTKPQTVAVLPLFAVLTLKAEPRQWLRAVLGGAAVTLLVLAPFAKGGQLTRVKDIYTSSVGYYSSLSSYAYNLWWALFGKDATTRADTDTLWDLVSYRSIGSVLFLGCVGYVLTRMARLPRVAALEAPRVFFAAAVCVYALFVLCTEMHERYLFPLVALGLPVALRVRAFRMPYAVATLLSFVNMLGWLPWTGLDRSLFETFPGLPTGIATIQTLTFAVSLRIFHAYTRGATAFARAQTLSESMTFS